VMNFKSDYQSKSKFFKVKPVLNEDLNLVLVVSHDKVVLGLTWFTGKFNKNCVLVSHEQLVIDWAYTLYKEYDVLGDRYLSINDIIEKNNTLFDGELYD